jgi:probable rRNA maturation factor
MINVEVSGPAVPRLSRSEIGNFVLRALAGVVRASGAPEARTTRIDEVSIAFVDDASMQSLNKKFRGKNKTTDVLTFPGEGTFLGDIVISLDQARRQARDERHSLATEVRYLILHGVLHALGFDHETDNGEMNALELKVRAKVGLS